MIRRRAYLFGAAAAGLSCLSAAHASPEPTIDDLPGRGGAVVILVEGLDLAPDRAACFAARHAREQGYARVGPGIGAASRSAERAYTFDALPTEAVAAQAPWATRPMKTPTEILEACAPF